MSVKQLMDRVRPAFNPVAATLGPSFPSGHSATAAAFYAMAALLLGRWRSRPTRAVLAGLAAAIAVGVAATRVLLDAHWLTDVIAGLALGWAWFAVCAIAFGGRILRFGAAAETVAQVAERPEPVGSGRPARLEEHEAAVSDGWPARSRPAAALCRHRERQLLGRNERSVRGRGARSPVEKTFAVEGHHFALVLVGDLKPASVVAYNVRLNGRVVWPLKDGRPVPTVHTRSNERRLRLAFGSCRVGDPQPSPTEFVKRTGVDALWAYARQLQRGEVEWPDALLLLGDQVYADEVSPAHAGVHLRPETSRAAGRGDCGF